MKNKTLEKHVNQKVLKNQIGKKKCISNSNKNVTNKIKTIVT